MTEVIVLLPEQIARVTSCIGLFDDDRELLDEIVADAMAARGNLLRSGCGRI